jgi:hypothetical protein
MVELHIVLGEALLSKRQNELELLKKVVPMTVMNEPPVTGAQLGMTLAIVGALSKTNERERLDPSLAVTFTVLAVNGPSSHTVIADEIVRHSTRDDPKNTLCRGLEKPLPLTVTCDPPSTDARDGRTDTNFVPASTISLSPDLEYSTPLLLTSTV